MNVNGKSNELVHNLTTQLLRPTRDIKYNLLHFNSEKMNAMEVSDITIDSLTC